MATNSRLEEADYEKFWLRWATMLNANFLGH